jgi:hypothetical protein
MKSVAIRFLYSPTKMVTQSSIKPQVLEHTSRKKLKTNLELVLEYPKKKIMMLILLKYHSLTTTRNLWIYSLNVEEAYKKETSIKYTK